MLFFLFFWCARDKTHYDARLSNHFMSQRYIVSIIVANAIRHSILKHSNALTGLTLLFQSPTCGWHWQLRKLQVLYNLGTRQQNGVDILVLNGHVPPHLSPLRDKVGYWSGMVIRSHDDGFSSVFKYLLSLEIEPKTSVLAVTCLDHYTIKARKSRCASSTNLLLLLKFCADNL